MGGARRKFPARGFPGSRRNQWKMDLKSGSVTRPAFDADFPAMGFYDPVADRQAQTETSPFF